MVKKVLLEAVEPEDEQYILDGTTRRVLERVRYTDFSTAGHADHARLMGERDIYLYSEGRLSEVVHWKYYGSEGSSCMRSSRVPVIWDGIRYDVISYHGANNRAVQKVVKYDHMRTTEYYFDVYSDGGDALYVGNRMREKGQPDILSRCVLAGAVQRLLLGTCGLKNNPRGAVRFVSLPLPSRQDASDELTTTANRLTLLEQSERRLSEFDAEYPYPNREWP